MICVYLWCEIDWLVSEVFLLLYSEYNVFIYILCFFSWLDLCKNYYFVKLKCFGLI